MSNESSNPQVSPLRDRLHHIARNLERPGCEPEGIVYAVTVDEAVSEIDRLTARVAELERYLMRIDVCSMDKEFMRKLAGEALYGKKPGVETECCCRTIERGAPTGEGPQFCPVHGEPR